MFTYCVKYFCRSERKIKSLLQTVRTSSEVFETEFGTSIIYVSLKEERKESQIRWIF